jgi:two-component system phosphate regulon sensor histidine kinase PhoR
MNDAEVSERFLDIIDIEAERLAILIEDILILSEIESMKIDRNVGVYPIADIVGEVIDVLSIKADQKNLQLNVSVQEDLPLLECNKDRIKQLLINLIDNSIKYTEEGSVSIDCSQSRDEQFLNIKITDTGIGIDEKHLERLFERFYRVDKGRSRKQGGTGLGLSIVKHIVELYHGKITVKSQVGQGTTMKVKLPFKI